MRTPHELATAFLCDTKLDFPEMISALAHWIEEDRAELVKELDRTIMASKVTVKTRGDCKELATILMNAAFEVLLKHEKQVAPNG